MNVNKVASAAQLRFDAGASPSLPEPVKARLQAARRQTDDAGTASIVITARRFRSQERNRDDARERLTALIRRAAEPPTPPPTRPTAGSVERRHRAKLRQGRLKTLRGRVRDERD